MTSRGLSEADFVKCADLVNEGIQISLEINGKVGKIISND